MIEKSRERRTPLQNTDSGNPLYRYRQDIDGLRGLAVIIVILFHANDLLLPSGFRGVDIFFVISGYVVTASVLRHQSKNAFEYFISFYKRRILRLMPALVVCVLTTTIVAGLFIHPPMFSKTVSIGSRALIGWSNNRLIASGSDYFDLNTALNPFTHTWSLGVEEQFYFVFPVILAFTYGLRRHPLENKRIAVAVLSVLIVASSLYCLHLTINNPLKAYYFMPSRFWEMASGSLLFAFLTAWPTFIDSIQKRPWIAHATQLCAAILIGFSLVFIPPQRMFVGAVLTTIGTLLFITAGLNINSSLNRFMSRSLWTYIGSLSYSLYLWHWPVFVMFEWTVGMNSVAKVLAALGITATLSLSSYYFVEQPVRKMRLPYRRVFTVALACVFVVGTGSVAMARSPMNGGLYQYKAYEEAEWSPMHRKTLTDDGQMLQRQCRMARQTTSISAIGDQFETCTRLAEDTSKSHLFMVGDSFTESLIPMADKVATETGIGITHLFSRGCFFSLTISLAEKDETCPQQFIHTLNLIEEKAKANDIVLIASRYVRISPENPASKGNAKPQQDIVRLNGNREIISVEKAYLQIEDELIEIANRLENKGIKLVLQAPTPEHRLPAALCVPAWFSGSYVKSDCLTEKTLSLSRGQRVMDLLDEAQSHTGNLYVWNVAGELCPDQACSHFDGDNPLFFDDNHLSVYGSQSLSSNFIRFLNSNRLIAASQEGAS